MTGLLFGSLSIALEGTHEECCEDADNDTVLSVVSILPLSALMMLLLL
jgi:hypothetical protein